MKSRGEKVISPRFLAVAELCLGLVGLAGAGFAWTSSNFGSRESVEAVDKKVDAVNYARLEDRKEINQKLDLILKTLLRQRPSE